MNRAKIQFLLCTIQESECIVLDNEYLVKVAPIPNGAPVSSLLWLKGRYENSEFMVTINEVQLNDAVLVNHNTIEVPTNNGVKRKLSLFNVKYII